MSGRRSGTAQAAQHRHAGPMKHRLQARGGARNEQAELLAEDERLTLPNYKRVDLLNASPHAFCDVLRLAASLGVSDAMMDAEPRGDHALAALLCVRGKYRYEHVRMLHEAYESGRMFVELRGEPTNMTWATEKDR